MASRRDYLTKVRVRTIQVDHSNWIKYWVMTAFLMSICIISCWVVVISLCFSELSSCCWIVVVLYIPPVHVNLCQCFASRFKYAQFRFYGNLDALSFFILTVLNVHYNYLHFLQTIYITECDLLTPYPSFWIAT